MLIGEALAATSYKDLTDERLWTDIIQPQLSNVSGVNVTPDTALGLSAYYLALRAVSEDVGKLPLILYRRTGADERDRAEDHELYHLIRDEPNPNMSSMTFRETLTHHAMGWGGGFAIIRRRGSGVPERLDVVHPSRVTIDQDRRGRVFYEVMLEQGEAPIIVLRRNMLHIHGLGSDGTSGYSVAQIAAQSLGRGLAATRFSAKFFGQGVTSTGVLELDRRLKDQEVMNRLRDQWDERYGGVENAHRPIILELGMKYKPISIPPEDAQLIETEKFTVEDVSRWFRIPPHKLMHLERSTFNNIEEQNQDYLTDTLGAWLVRWEEEIGRRILTLERREMFVEHLVDALLRTSIEKRWDAYRHGFNIGVWSQNDIRRRENAKPIGPEGDVHYIQGNMIRVEDAARGVTQSSQSPPRGQTDGLDAPQDGARAEHVLDLVTDAVGRCSQKEEKALARALSKDDAGLREWAGRFYARHQETIASSVQPVVSACAGLTGLPATDVRPIVESYCRGRQKLCEAGDRTEITMNESRALTRAIMEAFGNET